MSAKHAEYQERKDRILGIVVNQYIQDVSPVSSALIAQEYLHDLSPATIRNILAELEQEGLLSHPHTSAGRVPTQEGYRYFVDNLMNEIQLLAEEKARIKREYEQGVRDLEAIFDKTSQVLSDFTHYTSIISVDGWPSRVFCYGTSHVVEYSDGYDLAKISYILKMLEEKERLLKILNRDLERKIKIYIGHELALEEVGTCSLAVSCFRSENGHSGRIAILGPTSMNYPRVVSTLDYVSGLMGEILS